MHVVYFKIFPGRKPEYFLDRVPFFDKGFTKHSLKIFQSDFYQMFRGKILCISKKNHP